MLVILKKNITEAEKKGVRRFLADKNVEAIAVENDHQNLFVIVGRCGEITKKEIAANPHVSSIIDVDRPYKLSAKSVLTEKTKIKLGETVTIGNKKIIVMAGPCSVESKDQIVNTAREIKKVGAHILRGGAYKPRTAPYDFQGLGKIGLHFLKQASKETSLPVISEVLDVRDIEYMHEFIDIFQVGTRNMQNYPLLKELGLQKKPVLLKRGMWATYKEFLLAAEYILVGGNSSVILCERGIRTHVPETRFTLDLNIVGFLKHETHLPVFVDPSHGTGRASLVRVMSKAAIAAGADGLLIEAHLDPRRSLSDAEQAISIPELKKLIGEVKLIARAVDRH